LPGDVSHEAVARVLFDAAVHAPARAEVQRRREVEAAWEQKHLEDGGILALRRRWLRELRRAQGDRCAYCGTAFVAGTDARATLDHVVALARGGEDTRANCVAACHRCNQLKGAMDVELFRRWRPWLAGETSAVPGTASGPGAGDQA
jgi:5-methylcytosine-specific restriction endonuclease McrA